MVDRYVFRACEPVIYLERGLFVVRDEFPKVFARSVLICMSKTIPARIPWSKEWARATDSFLQNPLGPHTREEIRCRVIDAVIGNDARQLKRFIYPIGELHRGKPLEILASPRHLRKVAEKAKRHAAIVASLARGLPLAEAVATGKRFIHEAIRSNPGLGAGCGPVNHHWYPEIL